MKIGMIANSIQGGIWNHSMHLSCALQKKGHPVEMLSRNPPKRDIPHHRARAISAYSFEYFYHKSGIISKLKALEPDVIHTHHQLGNLDFFLPKIRRVGKPLVSTLHVTPSRKSRIDRLVSFYFRRIQKSLSSADRLICVSNYMKHEIEGLGLPDVSVIPNGVDTETFHPEREARHDLGIPEDEFTLLFVGRLSPEKGITKLLKAFKGIDSARLNIIGSGPLSSLCRLHSRKTPGINFLGRVSDSILRKNYSAADLTVFPSTWQEPFGMVLIESMACGTPVVAYSVGGVPEVVVNGRNGMLVTEKTHQALREAILHYRENPFPRGTAAFCTDYVKGRFSWESVASRTLDVYRRA
jgi:starch synthase